MREILFRGKQMDNGEWIEGYLTYRYRYDQQSKKEILGPVIDCPHKFTLGNATGIVIGSIKVVPGTEGQFTGLTDKNGVKIFEGDIVQATDMNDTDLVGMVVWRYDAWCVSGPNWADSLHMANYLHKLAVIGNIHDQPDLLEVSK